MIEGLTHEGGVMIKTTKYKGKISTGYAPGEGPNKGNYPVAAGFFRALKEVTRSQRIGRDKKLVNIKEWVVNEEIQKALEQSLPTPNATPRRLEWVSLYKNYNDMWESSLAMYSKDGLLCRSNGKGTRAKYLQYDEDGERTWIDRNGDLGCQYRECPDYIADKCKATGLLKLFPVVDMAPNPYRFETRSINTIKGMESSFQDLSNLLTAAHAVKQMEAGRELPFDGFFGAKLYLVHKKMKSGGREIYVTDLMPTPEFTESVMEPIKRGLKKKKEMSVISGAAGAVSILDEASQKLLTHADGENPVPMDLEDEKEIAVNFPAKGFEEENVIKEPEAAEIDEAADMGKKVAENLINDNKNVPKKG